MPKPLEIAPDGSLIEPLARSDKGSLARFNLAPGAVTSAVYHRTVEEFWYVLEGSGALWRCSTAGEVTTVPLAPGVHAHIETGTKFQFRADEGPTLVILGTTLPPWPGDGEAVQAEGAWAPT